MCNRFFETDFSSAPNAPKFICPKSYMPNLCAQAKKFGISMKKGFIERP